ncbi:MAG: cysteine desulfurase NifS [Candidatus Omnitrophica bacterium]|nr:cysteine desulfurase NifS [Candidatus Omnitrophota bacterium]MDD5488213.1 cysteine desulfurase NifS [Candidatus Omnitrophota bacterium]
MRKVYLDSNATTKVHPSVLEAMAPFWDEVYGNASSVHLFGREARKGVEKAREQVAALINASPEEIIFTSGGTESDNFALKGTANLSKNKGRHIITSSVEHHAVLNTCKYLEAHGSRVTYLGVDESGVVDMDELRESISADTALISIMAANNETGTIMPVEEIGQIAREKDIPFHTDAVQAIGKIPFDVGALGTSLVSISGHKIYGPKGIGALYVKKGTRLDKCQHGGHHERNMRAGTENVPGIVGLGMACELARTEGIAAYADVEKLRDKFYHRLENEIRQIKLNGHPSKRLPNTLNVSFHYLEGESIILSLDLEGIAASTGSACTSGSLESSHVLKSMGVDPLFAQGSVRFSFSVFNTEEDIDHVMEKMPSIINRLRQMSPVYKHE